MELKSKLEKQTGENFINYDLEKEIIKAFESIS